MAISNCILNIDTLYSLHTVGMYNIFLLHKAIIICVSQMYSN